MSRTLRLGRLGEETALRYLLGKGMLLRDRNWRCAEGEADLVMSEGEVLAFVEVKARTGTAYGQPQEAVDGAKARRLARVAQAYLADKGIVDVDWRIDVVAILFDAGGRVRDLAHFRDTWEAEPEVRSP